MQTWSTLDGKTWALFIDSSTGYTYKIFHDSKRFQIVQRRPLPLVPRSQNPRDDAIIGREVVNGIYCVGVASRANEGAKVGVAWISLDYDLRVKTDVRLGETGVVDEIYDIQHIEPDPQVFELPTGYVQL
jgi:hypothetical protein